MKKGVLFCILIIGVVILNTQCLATSLTIDGSDVTEGRVHNDGSAFGPPLIVRADHPTAYRTVLKFSLDDLIGISSSNIVSATLRLSVRSGALSNPGLLEIHNLTDSNENNSIASGDFSALDGLASPALDTTGIQILDIIEFTLTTSIIQDMDDVNNYAGFILKWQDESVTAPNNLDLWFWDQTSDASKAPEILVEYSTVTIPEPLSLILLGLGSIGLIFRKKRK